MSEEKFYLKLNYDEQIEHLKEIGVTFDKITPEDAKKYLKESCYYFKVTQYKANYNKNKDGKYVGLDFYDLKVLSKIDKNLRYEIMNLCLDVEHNLKVKFLDHICLNSDGYEPIKNFYLESPKDAEELKKKYESLSENDDKMNYVGELIKEYYNNMPAWIFFEIISFGTLMRFIGFYQKKYDYKIVDNRLLNNVRDIRNTVAHNNSIIRDLKSKNVADIRILSNYVAYYFNNIKAEQRNKRLQNKSISDFSSLICLHLTLVNDRTKFLGLKKIMNDISEIAYDIKNEILISSYDYCKKIFDNF